MWVIVSTRGGGRVRVGVSADYQDFKYKELTERIIKIFYRVYLRVSARPGATTL